MDIAFLTGVPLDPPDTSESSSTALKQPLNGHSQGHARPHNSAMSITGCRAVTASRMDDSRISLLDLPSEIRLSVYGFLFSQSFLLLDIEDTKSDLPYWRRLDAPSFWANTRQRQVGASVKKAELPCHITLTCHQIRAEPLPFFYPSITLLCHLKEGVGLIPALLPLSVLFRIRELRISTPDLECRWPLNLMPCLQLFNLRTQPGTDRDLPLDQCKL